jgi:hypothetical protein
MYTGPAAISRVNLAQDNTDMVELTQSNALADTNNNTTSNEYSELMFRRKSLHECGNDGQQSSSGHTPSPPESIGLK